MTRIPRLALLSTLSAGLVACGGGAKLGGKETAAQAVFQASQAAGQGSRSGQDLMGRVLASGAEGSLDITVSCARGGKAILRLDLSQMGEGLFRSDQDEIGGGKTSLDEIGGGRTGLEEIGTGRGALEEIGTGRSALDEIGTGRSALDEIGTGRSALDEIGTGRGAQNGTDSVSLNYDITYEGCSLDGKNELDGEMQAAVAFDFDPSNSSTSGSVNVGMEGRLDIHGAVDDFVVADVTMTMDFSAMSASTGTVTVRVNGTIRTSEATYTYSNETITVAIDERPGE